jgi:hypothetical protein
MGTDEQVMAWIMDTYSQQVGHTEPAVVTGKPPALGGSVARREATGRGLVSLVPVAAAQRGVQTDGVKVAIQGFGNVGRFAALAAQQAGAKVVAISDVSGAVYNAAFIEEYLGGLFNGNASAVTRAAVARALADPEVRTVMTYNDAGAYELQEGGKYASGFLAEPAYEGVKPKRLEAFRGHVLVVEMPVLTRQSDRWVYLTSRCRRRWELHSKRIPAHLFDCRDVNLAGSAGRWG